MAEFVVCHMCLLDRPAVLRIDADSLDVVSIQALGAWGSPFPRIPVDLNGFNLKFPWNFRGMR